MADDLQSVDRHLAEAGALPIYVVQGEERLLVDETVRRIVRAAVGEPPDPLALTRLDLAESTGAREVLQACRSLGLFARRQVVVARGAEVLDRKDADREALADYANAPEPATTLVLKATKLNGNSSLVRRAKKTGRVFTFEPLKSWQVPAWLMEEARRLGHPIEQATARLVADLTGTGLLELRLVMDQLSLYVGAGRPITREDVETLLASTRAHSVFELIDAVAEKSPAAALRHLHSMLEQREPALRILTMLIRHVRQLWQVAEARAKGESQADLAKRLGLHEFVLKKLWQAAPRFDERFLLGAFERLFRADLALKSSGLDDALVLERLVLDLAR